MAVDAPIETPCVTFASESAAVHTLSFYAARRCMPSVAYCITGSFRGSVIFADFAIGSANSAIREILLTELV